MKYIRTKDGRIIDTSTYLDKCWVKQQQGGTCKWETFGTGCGACRFNELRKVEVIKQADTIEELCDEFVCCIGKNTHWLSPFKDFYNTREQWNFETLYGAIWCEWGLKYVAKMNEKGEFELL